MLASALLLSACANGDDTSAGGVTQGESDALNKAAMTLDAQNPSPRLSEVPPKKPN
ncbi:MAG: hypothetical protein ACKVOJ_09975 [Sphingomonadaceae bacterium]